jgi:hypothetical protein
MPVGLGRSPLGTGPYGYGTPDPAPATGGEALTGDNGRRFGSRRIDPVTGQYVYDEWGRAVGAPDMHQMVYLAAKTTLGNAVDPTLGNDVQSIKDITDNHAQQVEAKLRAALEHLTSDGRIAIVGVETRRTGETRTATVLRWRDLTTGSEHDMRVA